MIKHSVLIQHPIAHVEGPAGIDQLAQLDALSLAADIVVDKNGNIIKDRYGDAERVLADLYKATGL